MKNDQHESKRYAPGSMSRDTWIEKPLADRLTSTSKPMILLQPDGGASRPSHDSDTTLLAEVNHVDPEEVDSLMARMMTQLSMKEREEIYNDLHGVADEVKESAQLIDTAIKDMKIALSKVQEDGAAYRQALLQDRAFVHSRKFLLRFLRAERFDVVRAATRLVKFYMLKLKAFGLEKLAKYIYQDDLTENERIGLEESMTYDLPIRDRAGRAIIFRMETGVYTPMDELLRRGIYASISYSHDEENQKKGLVIVYYLVGKQYCPEQLEELWGLNQHYGRLLACMPFRCDALHFCFDSTTWRPMTATFRMSANSFSCLRSKEHFGDYKAVRFELQRHGIPSLGFPVADDGTLLTHLCREHWQKRRVLEESVRKEKAQPSLTRKLVIRIQTPTQNDVLLGRGKAFYSHGGNLELRKIIMGTLSVYDSAPFAEKQHVSDVIVRMIHEKGGHFLKEDEAWWVEVDAETARKKVSHMFRSIRRESTRKS